MGLVDLRSQSTTTKSTPVLASVLEIFEPGAICQHPKAALPSSIATFRRFAAFIDAIVLFRQGVFIFLAARKTELRE